METSSEKSLAMRQRLISVIATMTMLLGWQLIASPQANASTLWSWVPSNFSCNRGDNGCISGTGFNTNASYWRMYSHPRGNCTNYLAFRLGRNGVTNFNPPGGGNAHQWRQNAINSHGSKVSNGTPAIGAVAWWTAAGWNGSLGHVAYVEKVSADKNKIWITESTWGIGSSRKTLIRGQAGWPNAFLHVKDAPTVRQLTAAPTPTISGKSKVGLTLGVKPGTWKPAPVGLKYQWKRGSSTIGGATKSTYTLTAKDLGKQISVSVTGSKSGYKSVTKTSKPTPIVAYQTLTSSPSPIIRGDTVVDSTLTATAGTWGPPQVALSYQWRRDGKTIHGATAAEYTLTQDDRGGKISVSVTGRKANYTSITRVSAETPAIVANVLTQTPVPVIIGESQLDQILTAESGDWLPSQATLDYQWLRNGNPIYEATSSTYQITQHDIGARLSVQVTGRLSGYADVVMTSKSTEEITAAEFTVAPEPVVSGKAQFGSDLIVEKMSWEPSPTALKYQWSRNGSAIPGATKDTYSLQAADIGASITVTVVASAAGHKDTKRTSPPTPKIAAARLTVGSPTLSGVATQARVLTVKPGTWTAGATLKYQWHRNGTRISGATSSTYKLTSVDVGKRISVVVTGSKSGYRTESATSATTSPVAKATLGTVMVKTQRQTDATRSSKQNGWYSKGTSLALTCYKNGQAVSGYYSAWVPGGKSKIWYQVNDGHFVADIDIYTGTNNPVTRKC